MNTSVIAFFSAENFFRLKTAEKQRERFDSLSDAFVEEFERKPNEDDWHMLLNYQAERAEIKRNREKAKLDKEKAKAEKLEAMPIAAGMDSANGHVTVKPKGRYVLTVAQNNTEIDKNFFAALQHYCNHMGAELLIAETTYNKKAFRQPGLDETDDLWFDPAIKPYLVRGQIDLGGTHFIADANVIVTAKWPTSGFGGITPNGINAIIPASKIELRIGAALKGAKTKIIASTGAVTKRNYILRKTGAIASFSHNIGAIFVDTINNEIRHIEQVDNFNGFYDLNMLFTSTGVDEAHDNIEALQFGDVHAEKMEQSNYDLAIDLVTKYQPRNIILHDVLDFSSRNHHNIKDPVFVHKQTMLNNTVENDIIVVTSFIDDVIDNGIYSSRVHIVESNHDLAINTWLKTADFKTDPINAIVYLTCMLAQYRHNEDGRGYFNMLQYAYKEIGGGGYDDKNLNFHETDTSLVIAGIEMGNHGHNGVNGSRGSPKQFAELGVKMNTGHTHSPSIYGGVYTAGVLASLNMDYNKGASGWSIANLATYDNGQRQIWFA